MIHYLATLFPDETCYSWFSRCYVHSGCFSHKHALSQFFCKRSDTVSKEFIGNLNQEARNIIEKAYSLEQLVLEHTMFSQYGRFLPLEQKQEAMHKLAYENCDFHHLFCVLPRRKGEQHLRYCPLCLQEDRKQGEAYYHRVHQIRDMRVCTKHKCELEETDVTATSHLSFTFCPAELYMDEREPIYCNNEKMLQYAEFIESVFIAPMDLDNNIPISAILYHGMRRTKYLKSSGRSRYTKNLVDDMEQFYREMGLNNIASLAQVQRTLLGEHCEFSVVCQIAFFLGMSVEELVSPKLTRKEIEQERKSHYMRDSAQIDWKCLDENTAPLLKQLAEDVYTGVASVNGRPERVSEKLMYRELGLLQHQLENLPKCRAIMKKYAEPYPECWARRILWAHKQLNKKGNVYWSDLRLLAGVKKANFSSIKPYLWKHGDAEIVREILLIAGDTQEID